MDVLYRAIARPMAGAGALLAMMVLALGASGALAVRAPRRSRTPRRHVTATIAARPGPSASRLRASAVGHPETRLLRLAHAPFPGHPWPDALVHVPAGLDPREPLSVVVFFHGWHGCAAVVAADAPGRCRPGGLRRVSLSLIAQLRESRAQAVLIVPQLAMEATTSDPGRFREPGFFRTFLGEVLQALAPTLGAHRVEDLERVVVAAHSGGSRAAMDLLDHGGVPIDEVVLLEAFYLGEGLVAHWIATHAPRFMPGAARPMRFVSIYRNRAAGHASWSLGGTMRRLFQGRPGVVLERRRETPLIGAEARAGIVLVRVPGNHAEAARHHLAAVLRAAPLRHLP